MDKQIVIFYTYAPFPFGIASSNRIRSLALCFIDAGYNVIILSNSSERECDYDKTTNSFKYKGIEYRNYYKNEKCRLLRIYNRINIFKLIKRMIRNEEIQQTFCIYFYGNYNLMSYLFTKYHKIHSVVDVVEWHNSEQFKGGVFNFKFIAHIIKNKYLAPLSENIICISNFLFRFYNNTCNTLVIPPQIESEIASKRITISNTPLQLFYAGTASKKDYLEVVLDGLCLLSEEEIKKISYTLVGHDMVNHIESMDRYKIYKEKIGGSLNVFNQVPKNEIDEMLSKIHFLVFMRPDCRYSRAGFPSKVPEALAAGVPIMTNLTSDLGEYLENRKNSMIVDEFSSEAFTKTIREALELNEYDLQKMSDNALQTAKNKFYYKNHTKKLMEFLNNIK